MSFKKSKLDLLVRVRYQNPLPAPPCPPKLLDIPTNPIRYTRPEFLDALANDTPLPMIVDAECGMPLDLGKWEALWEDGADDSALNPDKNNLPLLDPKDQFLLSDPSSSGGFGNGEFSRTGSGASTPLPAHVSWLRKTEYISREGSSSGPRATAMEIRSNHDTPDVSRDAQLRSVELSFAAANDNFDLAALRHPTKPHLTAESSYEILPDADIWANAYDLFRFSERPGDRPPDVEDPRLNCAIMRPMESDGDHFLAYYLTKEDEAVEQFQNARRAAGIDVTENEDEATDFHFVRDYEVVKVEQDVPNEFLLVFDEGNIKVEVQSTAGAATANGRARELRGRGAYYKNIERKMVLKKKRTEPTERFRDKWALVRVAHTPPSREEAEERAEALAEVVDPLYLLQRDADADGEEDLGPSVSVPPPAVENGMSGHSTAIKVDV
ncbi:hypothetical protein HETIRDRAFT_441150 [Heterobasidion irregulare TC 32-1]|uniref:RNA polymerase II-associated protein n=1 Tax=Heterobasidion irregulare (strain TC 32-1) TaxID=747525 RepID=W4K1R1_HETIT|nr:uncharacterized protein HETIRDRAFT_441150 [Heterobasidion irregulare TC 32-1]ETW79031.1 hypothetical protein HETIRDRAFT_441150 [Heterobasidion irregulare TC 32-1]